MTNHLTKDGRHFILRHPAENDAEDLIRYSKELFVSTDQVLTTPEEYIMTVITERMWIKNLNENPNSIILIAELKNEIVGLLYFIPNQKKKNSHSGEFGISVRPAFQGSGIGKILIESLMKWAKKNKQIEKVYLNVFDTNLHAIRLYKSLGFVEEGRHVKAIKQLNGEYVDVLQMYVETK